MLLLKYFNNYVFANMTILFGKSPHLPQTSIESGFSSRVAMLGAWQGLCRGTLLCIALPGRGAAFRSVPRGTKFT
jgi:hypothetical protein